MFAPTNIVRLASRAFRNSSSGGLTIGSRSDVPRCCVGGNNRDISGMLGGDHSSPIRSHRLISHTASTTIHSAANKYFCLSSNRYFSGNRKKGKTGFRGKGKKDIWSDLNDGIDRSKFVHEVDVEMPDVADDMAGEIVKWHKKRGDLIKYEDVICDIKTELVTFGLMAGDSFDSYMGEILIPVGSKDSDWVQPGDILCKTYHEEHVKEKEKEDLKDWGKPIEFGELGSIFPESDNRKK
mmetsp:Transcript_1875/g.3346  ORF Transcript_1875/g.3346 Transcript_1875/m.3346 type:complete len:238 (+) Transcript_1875:234-947(+)